MTVAAAEFLERRKVLKEESPDLERQNLYNTMSREQLEQQLDVLGRHFDDLVKETTARESESYRMAQAEVQRLILEKSAIFQHYNLDKCAEAAQFIINQLSSLRETIEALRPEPVAEEMASPLPLLNED